MPVIKLMSVGLPIVLGVVMIWHGGVTFAGPPSIRGRTKSAISQRDAPECTDGVRHRPKRLHKRVVE